MLNKYTHIFFLGAGGIGMSALVRYFMMAGKVVAGYDRTPSPLTAGLSESGVEIIFVEDPELLPHAFVNAEKTLVIYTPAIKSHNRLFAFFAANNFKMLKRAEVLGHISLNYKTIAVAGTHGKTSISSLTAHLLYQSSVGCTAILGGIAKNYDSNFLYRKEAKWLVTEADEFDRSFLNLRPDFAVVTSTDADHLDVYGSHDGLKESFAAFAGQVKKDGFLLMKYGVSLPATATAGKQCFFYAYNDIKANVYATSIKFGKEVMYFNLVMPGRIITSLEMANTGYVNIENAVAAAFIALKSGVTEKDLRAGLRSFTGVKRRFDRRFSKGGVVFIDDYAHHPEEIKALISSVRTSYTGRKITGIFQPHLFSRTKDFATAFAQSLEPIDQIILLDIYPAREEPIGNVSSRLIFDQIKNPKKVLLNKEDLPGYLEEKPLDILLTIGAGDIDRLVEPIRQMLIKKFDTP
jgi:UDP-N-acetylmuramate--alanine ligase